MQNNAIIELYDNSFENVISCYGNFKYSILKKVNYYDDFETSCDYDTVIFLENDKVEYSYVYRRIIKYLDLGKNLIILYKIKEYDLSFLEEYARKMNSKIEFRFEKDFNNSIINIDIPVIFISGNGKNCDQLTTHLILKHIFESRRINTLNYSNSNYSDFFYLKNFNDMFDISNIDFLNLNHDINKKINNDIDDSKAEVLIISDMYGILPYNAVEHNYFGLYNNIIKYACPYDYFFYNLYATEYNEEDLNNMVAKAINYVNINTICLGLSHASTTMGLGGLANSDEYVKLVKSEYGFFYDNLKKVSKFDIVDTQSYKDIENYILKFMI